MKNLIITAINNHVHQKTVTSRWNLPWITPAIGQLTRRKKCAWRSAQKFNSADDWSAYQELKSKSRRAIEKAKTAHDSKLLDKHEISNPKKFYPLIKNKRSDQNSRIPPLRQNEKNLTEPKPKPFLTSTKQYSL